MGAHTDVQMTWNDSKSLNINPQILLVRIEKLKPFKVKIEKIILDRINMIDMINSSFKAIQ
jgi:hypothetical protein